MNLQGKTVLVTGAGSGIGQAIAIAFAQKGATILIHYRKSEEGALATLEAVKKYTEGKLYKADLTKISDVQKMFEGIASHHKQIDILVNNAGDAKPGDIFDNDTWEYQFKSILMSSVYVSQEFLKQNAVEQRKIINISSFYAGLTTGNPKFMSYSAAKAALSSMTINLAKEMGKKVLVNGIAPGYTWTPAWEGISMDERKEYEQATKIERFITPEEIAHTAIFLAENDAITGEIISIDGGLGLVDLK